MKPLECKRLNAKNRVQAGEKNLVVSSVKSGKKVMMMMMMMMTRTGPKRLHVLYKCIFVKT